MHDALDLAFEVQALLPGLHGYPFVSLKRCRDGRNRLRLTAAGTRRHDGLAQRGRALISLLHHEREEFDFALHRAASCEENVAFRERRAHQGESPRRQWKAERARLTKS